jgi:hypothetical protein
VVELRVECHHLGSFWVGVSVAVDVIERGGSGATATSESDQGEVIKRMEWSRGSNMR